MRCEDAPPPEVVGIVSTFYVIETGFTEVPYLPDGECALLDGRPAITPCFPETSVMYCRMDSLGGTPSFACPSGIALVGCNTPGVINTVDYSQWGVDDSLGDVVLFDVPGLANIEIVEDGIYSMSVPQGRSSWMVLLASAVGMQQLNHELCGPYMEDTPGILEPQTDVSFCQCVFDMDGGFLVDNCMMPTGTSAPISTPVPTEPQVPPDGPTPYPTTSIYIKPPTPSPTESVAQPNGPTLHPTTSNATPEPTPLPGPKPGTIIMESSAPHVLGGFERMALELIMAATLTWVLSLSTF